MKHTLKQIVSGTTAKLVHVCQGKVLYQIDVEDSSYHLELDSTSDDWKTTFLEPEMKSILLMRWIRKGIEKNDNTFIQVK